MGAFFFFFCILVSLIMSSMKLNRTKSIDLALNSNKYAPVHTVARTVWPLNSVIYFNFYLHSTIFLFLFFYVLQIQALRTEHF